MNSLSEKFNKELKGKLKDELKIANTMAVPKLLKIVLNMGVKDAIADKKNLERGEEILAQVSFIFKDFTTPLKTFI